MEQTIATLREKRKLGPHEVCEFASRCSTDPGDCPGKDASRPTELSCGLRRFLLAFGDEILGVEGGKGCEPLHLREG